MHPTVRKIAVATVTRDRPLMLSRLLASYSKMILPANLDITFLIVENNLEKNLQSAVDEFRRSLPPYPVVYINEPRLGIASARNCALQWAIDNAFDILTFADDDEEVDRNWLYELLNERDAGDLDIVGSPVRVAPVDPSCSRWKKLIWQAVCDVNRNAEKRSIKRHRQGQADTLRLATGSWLAKLEFFRKTGLRFNEGLGLAGGEDWALYATAKSKGARTGWSPHALAYESLPDTRLSLSYYYRRNRDHARTVFRERYKKNRMRSLLRLAGSLVSRFYKSILALFALPFNPGRSILTFTYCIGSSVGFFQGFLGIESRHYSVIDGR